MIRVLLCVLLLTLSAEANNRALILIADDLSATELASYGPAPDQPSTPNLDALAAGGLRFETCWANPLCSPSRAALWTTRYAHRAGIWSAYQTNPLQEPGMWLGEPSVWREAQDAGIPTAMFGKYHLAPYAFNFVTGELLDQQPGGAKDHPNSWGIGRFFGNFASFGGDYFNPFLFSDGQFLPNAPGYLTTRLVDEAISWIGQQPGDWLVAVPFNLPHGPYQWPPDELHTVPGGVAGDYCQPGNYRPCYKAMVEAMDAEIGRLLAAMPPDVLVIFCADNGTPRETVAPGVDPNHAKQRLFEPGIRVPLIMSGPGVVPGVSTGLVHLVDVGVTALARFGLTAPPGSDGMALLNLPAATFRSHLFSTIGRPIIPSDHHQHDAGLVGYGATRIECEGDLLPGSTAVFHVKQAPPNESVLLVYSTGWDPQPWLGALLGPAQPTSWLMTMSDASGSVSLPVGGYAPPGTQDLRVYIQAVTAVSFSNALELRYYRQGDIYRVAAARDDRWKLIWALWPNQVTQNQYGATQLLYDLQADPNEETDLLSAGVLSPEAAAAKADLEAFIMAKIP